MELLWEFIIQSRNYNTIATEQMVFYDKSKEKQYSIRTEELKNSQCL